MLLDRISSQVRAAGRVKSQVWRADRYSEMLALGVKALKQANRDTPASAATSREVTLLLLFTLV